MSELALYVLVSIRENALMGSWSFRAADELSVARRLLQDPWEYEDVFWALRLSPKDVERLTAEELLQAIRDSYPNSRVRAVLHLLRVSQVADCVQTKSLRSALGDGPGDSGDGQEKACP